MAIIVSSFSDRDERERDEYHDKSNSSSNGTGSSVSNSSDEHYSSGVLEVPLEVL